MIIKPCLCIFVQSEIINNVSYGFTEIIQERKVIVQKELSTNIVKKIM